MISFHRVLIATAIVFCAGFAMWALGRYLALQSGGMLALAVTFAVFAAALIYYLTHLRRFLGR